MDSVASFRIPAFEKKYIVDVQNLFGDGTMVPFCFDTGANVSLIGLNTVCGKDRDACDLLKQIVGQTAKKNKIAPFHANSVAMEEMLLYPCRSEDVSIAGTSPMAFYFHIYLGRIGVALLGFDYINSCSFTHEIGKSIYVNAVDDKMSRSFYANNVIDFHEVMKQFRAKTESLRH